MTGNKKIHFEVSERRLLLQIFDIVSVFVALYCIEYFFDFSYFSNQQNLLRLSVFAIYLWLFGSIFEMYNLQISSSETSVAKSVLMTSTATVFLYLLTPLIAPSLPANRLQILYFFLSVFGGLMLWRCVYARFLASQRFTKKVMLVCDSNQAKELIENLTTIDPHYRIWGFLNSDLDSKKHVNLPSNTAVVTIEELSEFLYSNSISEIVVASKNTENVTMNLYNKLLELLENGFIIRDYTQVYESITKSIPLQYVAQDFYRHFPFSRSNQNRLYLAFARTMDVLISIIGVFIGVCFVPLILIGNAIGNQGKLFYTQERVGIYGKKFKIIKFRSMVSNAEVNGAVFATAKDSRITPFGRFLRKSRLDEFPQFINVLKGEMSVIGPRPERPIFVDQIASEMPFYQARHVIKPGLTGWAQVNFSYGESLDDSVTKLQYDLYYIKHRSVFIDLSIMIKTLTTVVFYRGT